MLKLYMIKTDSAHYYVYQNFLYSEVEARECNDLVEWCRDCFSQPFEYKIRTPLNFKNEAGGFWLNIRSKADVGLLMLKVDINLDWFDEERPYDVNTRKRNWG